MGCFLVPVAEAVVTTIISKGIKSKEEKQAASLTRENPELVADTAGHIPFSRKLGWLSKLLWGGSALLAFEHVWHGEVTAWFPFLTGAAEPQSMLQEMATVGVSMSLLVTAVWGVMLLAVRTWEKRSSGRESVVR